jgi:hypothetical protein
MVNVASRCTRPRACAGDRTASSAYSRAAAKSPRPLNASAHWASTSPGWTYSVSGGFSVWRMRAAAAGGRSAEETGRGEALAAGFRETEQP